MRYELTQDGQLRAGSHYLKDLCTIIAAYTAEEVLDLEEEYFRDGKLKRGALTIEPMKEE